MIRPRRALLLLWIGLIGAALASNAWAHPLLDPRAASADRDVIEWSGARVPTSPAPSASPSVTGALDNGPPALALVAGALVLLGALPNRRRTLGLVLTLLLALVAAEGTAHAALHLGHVRHGDALAIDTSGVLPPAAEPAADSPDANPLASTGAAPIRVDAQWSDGAVSLATGRGPPAVRPA